MFTQRDEEPYIMKFFKNVSTGRFLDIGAFDGQCFSTTRALALKGWGGVCVEPSPSALPALRKRYEDSKIVHILDTAIYETSGMVDFFDSGGDMISSVNTDHVEKWKAKAGCKFTKIQVPCLSVNDLFEKVGYDFNFISLDVEGTNFEIISKFPFDKLQATKMICVEFDHQQKAITELMSPFGYVLLHRTSENLIMTRT